MRKQEKKTNNTRFPNSHPSKSTNRVRHSLTLVIEQESIIIFT